MANANLNRVFTCQQCAVEFTGRKKKFCSPVCREASARLTKDYTCVNCGSPFIGRKRKHCTIACQSEHSERRKAERKGVPPSGKTRRQSHPIVNGYRKCLDCERDLAISEFPKSRKVKTGYCGQCKTCRTELNRNRKRNRPQAGERNYLMERIRTAAYRGECGPPAYEQYLEAKERREAAIKRHPTEREIDLVAKQNAGQAWRYWIKEKAPDEWCERYFEAAGEPWMNPRIPESKRYRLRYRGDHAFAAQERMRRQLNKALKKDGVADLMRDALSRNGRSNRVEAMLGYSIRDLRLHLEKQFTRGMSWDVFATGEIHIDHIVPQAEFNLTAESEWIACWSLSNLRPCWARENLSKSSSRMFLV